MNIPRIIDEELLKQLNTGGGIDLPSNDLLDQVEQTIEEDLNSKGGVEKSEYDLRAIAKGFKNGKIEIIKDAPRTKIFVSSFHVNKQDNATNKLTNITLYKYKEIQGIWKLEKKIILDNPSKFNYPVKVLYDYLSKQLALDGHKLESEYAKVLEGKTASELEIYSNFVDKIKNINDKDKLNEIISAVTENKAVVIDYENYKRLLNTRYSPKLLVQYKKDLIQFRSLIDDKSTTETDMQNFLGKKGIDRSWFFGLDYVSTQQKFNPGFGCEFDFLIKRFNLVFDIAELKSPNDRIIEPVKEYKKRNQPDPRIDYGYTTVFGRALHQVIKYIEKYENHFELVKEQNSSLLGFEGVRYPRGIIIMSKRILLRDVQSDIHKLNRQFSNIEVLTYDDLYDRANKIISFLTKSASIKKI